MTKGLTTILILINLAGFGQDSTWYVGSQLVNKAYIGSTLVFDNSSPPSLPANLVAYYPFNWNVNDSVASNDGTINGDPAYITGQEGQALDFDGAGDWVTVAANDSLAVSGSFTLSSWVYFNSTIPSGWVGLVEHDRFGGNWYALFKLSGSPNIRFKWGNTSNLDGSVSLSADTWYHVIGTYNADTDLGKLYINGVEDDQLSDTNTPDGTTGQFRMGANNSGGEALNGRLDDVRVYDVAFSDQDALDLYNSYTENVAPSGLALSDTTILEGTTGLVGTLSVSEGTPTPTYSITGGTDQADFSIQNTDELHLDNSKTHPDTLSVQVTATNSEGTDVLNSEINITDAASAQATLDALIGLSEIDLGYSMARATDGSGGAYSDASVTNYITSGEVQSIKGFGSNMISAPNLPIEARDEQTFIDVWYTEDYATVVDDGDLDVYINFNNSKMRYHSSPSTYTDPIDIVGVARVMPGPNYETNGIFKWPNIDATWEVDFMTEGSASPTITTNLPDIFYRFHYRITVDASGNWEVRFNDLQKVTPDASGTGYAISQTQHWFGANGHPQPIQEWFRAFNFQSGGFTGTALTNIESYFDTLWPEGYDSAPHLRDSYIVSYNTTTNVLSTASGTFGGGNGNEGTHLYQWYASDESYYGNKLDWYYALDGETSASLDRDDLTFFYEWIGEDFGSTIWFTRTCTPRDNANTEGVTFMTQPFSQGGDNETVTPNTINSASVTSITTTTATGNVTTPRTGTGYAVVTTSATAPNARGIANGYDATQGRNAAVWSDSQAFGTTGAKTWAITGLSSGTNYWLHQVVFDSTGLPSLILTTSFTTL